MTRQDYLRIGFIALFVGVVLLVLIDEPGYGDAYYYYNAGHRLAAGDGLTDPYLWTYIYTPDELPHPSHTYWMPLTSLLAAASMAIFGLSFTAAQLPSLLTLIGLVLLTAWLGYAIGGRRRYGWLGALLVLAGGYYLPFWLTTDHFALYGLLGAGSLVAMGLGRRDGDIRWFALCGALVGLAHLTRADGALLGAVSLFVVWWGQSTLARRGRWQATLALAISYGIVMLPWILRNLHVIGTPLPVGGAGTIFLRGYNELFAYPVDWSLSNFLDWGATNILESRAEAAGINFMTWFAVEGMVMLGPLAIWGWWRNRQNPLLFGFSIYAIALHFVMTFLFAYPGYRGGLLHSSSALLPFWMILGVLGLDAGIEVMAKWRNWKVSQAQAVFGTATIVLALGIGVVFSRLQSTQSEGTLPHAQLVGDYLPDDAVLMVNSPPEWYYFTGLGGVTLPDAPLERLPEIAERYCLTHLIIDINVTDSFVPLIEGTQSPPAFLEEIAHIDQETETVDDDIRIYEFRTSCQASN